MMSLEFTLFTQRQRRAAVVRRRSTHRLAFVLESRLRRRDSQIINIPVGLIPGQQRHPLPLFLYTTVVFSVSLPLRRYIKGTFKVSSLHLYPLSVLSELPRNKKSP